MMPEQSIVDWQQYLLNLNCVFTNLNWYFFNEFGINEILKSKLGNILKYN